MHLSFNLQAITADSILVKFEKARGALEQSLRRVEDIVPQAIGCRVCQWPVFFVLVKHSNILILAAGYHSPLINNLLHIVYTTFLCSFSSLYVKGSLWYLSLVTFHLCSLNKSWLSLPENHQ